MRLATGSGTAFGVYTSDSVWPAWSKFQPNVPATGFRKPLVSKVVAASNIATSVGPLYVPAHRAAGPPPARQTAAGDLTRRAAPWPSGPDGTAFAPNQIR